VVARFLAGVAHWGAGLDGALPLDRTGAGKDRFKEAGSLWADNPCRRS
jgi:hypothetical protein